MRDDSLARMMEEKNEKENQIQGYFSGVQYHLEQIKIKKLKEFFLTLII
jgi:predicted solute-binding protein